MDSRCQTCGLEGEDPNHVLFMCNVARQIWALSNVLWPQSGFHSQSLFSNFSYVLVLKKNASIPLLIRRSIPWILWVI